jgi:hypothetical protein
MPPAPHLQPSDVSEAQFVCKFGSELEVESPSQGKQMAASLPYFDTIPVPALTS